MADLSPQLLAQLEGAVANWSEGPLFRFEVYSCPQSCCCRGTAHVTDTHGDGCVIVVEDVSCMLNAVPALVAAAKERDQLRAEVERLRKLGTQCLVLLDVVRAGELWALKAINGELPRIRAEIERKP